MSQKAKMLLEVCQLWRKYDAHLIGAAPNTEFVNKLFTHTDIVDLFIHKISKRHAFIDNKVSRKNYHIYNIPRTEIPFISKDIASFDMVDPKKKEEEMKDKPVYVQAAELYIVLRSVRKVAKELKVSAMMVSKYLDKYQKERLRIPVN